MRKVLLSAIATLGLIFSSGAETAPDFTLKSLDGKDISLSSLKGNIVVIDFWAMWCHACKEAFPELNGIKNEFGGKGLTVIGVNLENSSTDKVDAFVKKAGIEYTVLPDQKSSTAKLYGIKGVPSLVIIDRNQNIVKTFRGLNSETKKDVQKLLEELTKS